MRSRRCRMFELAGDGEIHFLDVKAQRDDFGDNTGIEGALVIIIATNDCGVITDGLRDDVGAARAGERV